MKKKPQTEVALSHIQRQFLKSRNPQYLIELYRALYPYVRSLLLKFIKNKIFLPPETITSTAQDICLLIIDKYKVKKDFKIESSFAGYIKYKIMEILYAPQKVFEEQCGSLNAVLSAEQKKGKSTEVGELAETLKFEYLFPTLSMNPEEHFFKVDTTATIKSVWTVIEDIATAHNEINLKSWETLTIGLMVWLFLNRDPARIERLYQSRKVTESVDDAYEFALLEIKNRLAGKSY